MRHPSKIAIAVVGSAAIASGTITPANAQQEMSSSIQAQLEAVLNGSSAGQFADLGELVNRPVNFGAVSVTVGQIAAVLAATAVGATTLGLVLPEIIGVKPGPDGSSPYEQIIANPKKYARGGGSTYFEPNGDYNYALVEATGDDSPELLLHAAGTEINPVTVFTIRNGRAVAMRDTLEFGATSAGGYRAGVYESASGKGVYQLTGYSLKPVHNLRLMKLGRNNLQAAGDTDWDWRRSKPADAEKIKWCKTSEKSCLGNL